ncbi:septation protein SepH [Cellulomonas soli]|uniref:septation protein SepH n=1 Tax=Cellulomonas soli TaxID=931535 RepID=UPI003F8540F7
MGELELVGLHEDGEHLVLAAPDGTRFRVRIDEALRAAVRRDRPQLEQLRHQGAGALSPREIQSRIRAGATAQEVADDAGLAVEHVRRYEGPVLAEREYVADQARATRVGRDAGAPLLGDLVTDRLAARGVDLDTLAWDAARDGTHPWVVLARFAVGDDEHVARWTYDAAKRTVVADEDEARWLSETEIADEPVSRRHLSAVRDVVFDFRDGAVLPTSPDAPPVEPDEPDPLEATSALLDDLRTRRGVRQLLDEDDDGEEFEGFGPPHAFDFARLESEVPGAHPVDADPDQEARVLGPVGDVPALPSAEDPQEQAPRTSDEDVAADTAVDGTTTRPRAARRGRAKVPSWDEIVFGAKPE